MKQKKWLSVMISFLLITLLCLPYTSAQAASLPIGKLDYATETAYKLELDYQLLNITFGPGESANSVTSSLILPVVCANQSTVIWYSDTPSIISTTGKVTRPTGADTLVTLTAILINNNQSRVKQFSVCVKGSQIIVPNVTGINDNYIVAEEDTFSLNGVVYATSRITNITVQLCKNDKYNKVISEIKVSPWTTSYNLNGISFDTDYLDLDEGNYLIKIFVQSENYFDTSVPLKVCSLTITEDEEDLLDDEKDFLKIIFSGNDKSSQITASISLPVLGKYGCSIAWASSNPAIISAQGVVNRPLYDTKVKLTATISINGFRVTKSFQVVVLGTYVRNSITITQSEKVVNNKTAIVLNWKSNLKSKEYRSVNQTSIQIYTYGTNDLRFDMTAGSVLTSCTTRLDPGVYTVKITYSSASGKPVAAGETTIVMR